ncbi:RimJ/RimL family protein N-acetyltransferase [Catenulispora sp. MAP12-49]|uniref:GNAT family N-acetyltransferase n=1 Tax=Catenulispora sp. MAP12-49 TaxID=3156302 RepID=UPI00351446D6
MITFRPVDVDSDAEIEMLHRWVTHPKAQFWLMQDFDVEQVRQEYRRIAEHPHHEAFLGLIDGNPAFLAERYDPGRVELVGLYEHEDGDVGMHFLCAPTDTPVHGFTRAVLTAVLAWIFADPDALRVVVEPDVRNTAVQALNAAVGFRVVGPIAKPEKQALLSVCTWHDFQAATTAAVIPRIGAFE